MSGAHDWYIKGKRFRSTNFSTYNAVEAGTISEITIVLTIIFYLMLGIVITFSPSQ
jgi:hypothetical protein